MTNEQFSLIMCELTKLETKIEKLEGLIGVASKATVAIQEPVCAEDFSRFVDLSTLKIGEVSIG